MVQVGLGPAALAAAERRRAAGQAVPGGARPNEAAWCSADSNPTALVLAAAKPGAPKPEVATRAAATPAASKPGAAGRAEQPGPTVLFPTALPVEMAAGAAAQGAAHPVRGCRWGSGCADRRKSLLQITCWRSVGAGAAHVFDARDSRGHGRMLGSRAPHNHHNDRQQQGDDRRESDQEFVRHRSSVPGRPLPPLLRPAVTVAQIMVSWRA